MDKSTGNALAKLLQTAVPFVSRPFRELANQLGVPEEEVIAELEVWNAEGQLREISAVLEGSRLGHDSALVAGSVPESRIEEVAQIISEHPMVTHNYQRDHLYNLWFTIASPPSVSLGASVRCLARMAGGLSLHPMRRTETFKIGVRFDMETLENTSQVSAAVSPDRAVFVPDAVERRLLSALQRPLPYCERPFETLAEEASVSEAELLSFASSMQESGVMRRYVATFRHRKLGVRGNGMVVWSVSERELSSVGRVLAEAPEVSHCYARTTAPDFPYPLYSMIHARDDGSVLAIAERLRSTLALPAGSYRSLFSTREFKKVRLRYFLPELDMWNRAHMHQEA